MLFRKKIEKNCAYCRFSTQSADGELSCTKRRSVPADYQCWKFQYDPLKRQPSKPKALDFSKYDEEDFSL